MAYAAVAISRGASTEHGRIRAERRAPRFGRSLRAGDLIVAIDKHWGEILDGGGDLAVRFGRVDAASSERLRQGAGRVDFCVDLRGDDVAVLRNAPMRCCGAEAASIAASRGVRFDFGQQSRSQPTRLSTDLGNMIADAAKRLSLPAPDAVQGAAMMRHDLRASELGLSVMVFLRNWNGSHRR